LVTGQERAFWWFHWYGWHLNRSYGDLNAH
jgi:hypothetical protein